MKVDWSKEYKVMVDRPAVLPCDEGLLFLHSSLQLIEGYFRNVCNTNLVSFVIPELVDHCALGALSSLFF